MEKLWYLNMNTLLGSVVGAEPLCRNSLISVVVMGKGSRVSAKDKRRACSAPDSFRSSTLEYGEGRGGKLRKEMMSSLRAVQAPKA